jgi:hypothetical protein
MSPLFIKIKSISNRFLKPRPNSYFREKWKNESKSYIYSAQNLVGEKYPVHGAKFHYRLSGTVIRGTPNTPKHGW